MTPPFRIDLDAVLAARRRIAPHLAPTPTRASWIDAGTPLLLKLEAWQPTGSFKVRGALSRLAALSERECRRGIVTASAGNHGLGVAYAARALGARVETTVFVPESTPATKRAKLSRFPIALRVEGGRYEESDALARAFAEKRGAVYVHAFEDPLIAAGQGTVALELLEQVPELDAVVVPVGGGGLIVGIAVVLAALRPTVRVIAVQPAASPALRESIARGEALEDFAAAPTLADGVAGGIGSTVFAHRELIDQVVHVDEHALADAMRALLEHDQVIAEGSGALGVAAVLSGRLASRGGALAAVVTGSNVDGDVLRRVVGARP